MNTRFRIEIPLHGCNSNQGLPKEKRMRTMQSIINSICLQFRQRIAIAPSFKHCLSVANPEIQHALL